ncbi:hypothetical protein ACJX0J_018152, partial [Zea mays]
WAYDELAIANFGVHSSLSALYIYEFSLFVYESLSEVFFFLPNDYILLLNKHILQMQVILIALQLQDQKCFLPLWSYNHFFNFINIIINIKNTKAFRVSDN